VCAASVQAHTAFAAPSRNPSFGGFQGASDKKDFRRGEERGGGGDAEYGIKDGMGISGSDGCSEGSGSGSECDSLVDETTMEWAEIVQVRRGASQCLAQRGGA
jgi:hypothetical protein